MRTLGRFLITFLAAGFGLALAALFLAPEVKAFVTSGESSGEAQLRQLEQLAQRSIVYRRDGSVFAVLHAEENRSPVALKRVPTHLVNAILAMEDERFWQHGGVDLRSTARALFTNASAGEVRQGGSTITQQLVKNALLTPERTAARKVKEAVLAVRLENELTKEQILERYLNTVYFGNGAYGVQAAAETYFGGDVSQVTTAQAALLAGVIRNPTGYDPFKNAALARQRRDLALDMMVLGRHLTAAQAETLKQEALPKAPSRPLPPPNDYFVEEVKQRLLEDPRLGETAQERYNAVFKGGLHIHTTVDARMQDAARRAVNTILPNTKQRFTAALVSVDSDSGAVRAMVAGPNFDEAKFNLVTQGKRQPGSSFKPFVLAAAIEAGYGPRNSINGTSPCPVKQGRGKPWLPANYEGAGGGVMSLTSATANSTNCAYVRLGLKVGLKKVADMARRLGITTPLDEVPAMSLGTEEVLPLDMAGAFATLANDGVRHRPYFVERVTDRTGKVVLRGRDDGEQVITPQTARVAVSIMRSVVERGTAVRARLPGRQVAGKTGTSQNWENAWFVGFTPQMTTAVWMGSPVGNVSMRGVGGRNVTGGSFPAAIWQSFMAVAMEGMPIVKFKPPDPKQLGRGGFIADPPEAKGSKCAVVPGSTAPKCAATTVPLPVTVPSTVTTIPIPAVGTTTTTTEAPTTTSTTTTTTTQPPQTTTTRQQTTTTNTTAPPQTTSTTSSQTQSGSSGSSGGGSQTQDGRGTGQGSSG